MRRLLYALIAVLGVAGVASADSLSSSTSTMVRLVPPGANFIGIQVDGTYSGTLEFTYSINGSTYNSLTLYPDGTGTAATGTTSTGIWRGQLGGVTYVKVAFSSYTSGTATVDMKFDESVQVGSVGNTNTPGGTSGLLQYNNGGAFGGVTGGSWSGTVLTLPASTIARIKVAGTAPTVADTSADSCGTGTQTISGFDNAAKVTVIGSAGTSCTVTFSATFTTAPVCVATNETTATELVSAVSTATTVVLAGTFAENDVIGYICIGR